MASEDTEVSEFDQCLKSDKAIFTIYADFECITSCKFIYNKSS